MKQVTGYSLTFDGNAMLPQSNHLRFKASLSLFTNRTWQDFHLRGELCARPVWDVRAVRGGGKADRESR